MSTDIIQRLRGKLPLGASITEDDDCVIFRAPGQRPVIYNVHGVTFGELADTVHHIIETAKAVSFGKVELCPDCGAHRQDYLEMLREDCWHGHKERSIKNEWNR